MSKKLPNRNNVTNLLVVTTKFYTKNGWPWCRSTIYANGWWCGRTDKYTGSGLDAAKIIDILEESGHLPVGLNRDEYRQWCALYNIHVEVDNITVGRLKDL